MAAPGTDAPGRAAPGWYSDPGAPGTLRWWDGGTWTDDVAATAQATGFTSPPGNPWVAPNPLYLPGSQEAWSAGPPARPRPGTGAWSATRPVVAPVVVSPGGRRSLRPAGPPSLLRALLGTVVGAAALGAFWYWVVHQLTGAGLLQIDGAIGGLLGVVAGAFTGMTIAWLVTDGRRWTGGPAAVVAVALSLAATVGPGIAALDGAGIDTMSAAWFLGVLVCAAATTGAGRGADKDVSLEWFWIRRVLTWVFAVMAFGLVALLALGADFAVVHPL